MKVSCGVCQFSGASRDIPEPQTTNVDPARTNAVIVPNTTPPVAVLTVPNVAALTHRSPDPADPALTRRVMTVMLADEY